MANPNTIYLSPAQFFCTLGLFVVLVIAVFGGIPMIRRSDERGENMLFDMRAVLVLYRRAGLPFMASGGNFFRITMYDDFLLVTFLLQQKIAYKEIDAIKLIPKFLSEVRLTVGKTHVRIFGRRAKVEMLYSALRSRLAASP